VLAYEMVGSWKIDPTSESGIVTALLGAPTMMSISACKSSSKNVLTVGIGDRNVFQKPASSSLTSLQLASMCANSSTIVPSRALKCSTQRAATVECSKAGQSAGFRLASVNCVKKPARTTFMSVRSPATPAACASATSATAAGLMRMAARGRRRPRVRHDL